VSRRTLQRAVQAYRQALKAEALATTRFETPAGRQLQIDFGERLVEISGVRVKAFAFVATLGHSRRLHLRAFRNEQPASWFVGLESAFTTFGGVPGHVLMDNPRALVVRHDAVIRTVLFNDKLLAFAQHWGFSPRACVPYRARTKGKTESGVGYIKKNAIAGRGTCACTAGLTQGAWMADLGCTSSAGAAFACRPIRDFPVSSPNCGKLLRPMPQCPSEAANRVSTSA
jgi:transposase